MSNEQLITLSFRDRVAIVTLNRPDKLNALNQDLYYLLGERLREIDQRDDIYITVLTGTGRFFSAYASISTFTVYRETPSLTSLCTSAAPT
jgi:peroxisomal 3,2-trans-enoyl-CoA isomerase